MNKFYCNLCEDSGRIEIDPTDPREARRKQTTICPHLMMEKNEYDILEGLSGGDIFQLPKELLKDALENGYLNDKTELIIKKVLTKPKQ